MTIFLTGLTGFVGSTVLARMIAREEHRFVLLVRAKSLDHAVERTQRYLAPHFDEANDFQKYERLLRERIIVGDLTRAEESFANDSRFLQCRRVLHMAANTYFGSRYDGGLANIVGARTMFDAACERLSDRLERYVHCSTSWVSGVPNDLNNVDNNNNILHEVNAPIVIRENLVNNDDDKQKNDDNNNNNGFIHTNEYTRDKALTERYLLEKIRDGKDRRTNGAPLLIARPSNIVGHSELGTRVPGNLFWPFRAACLLARHTWHPSSYIDVVPVDWVADSLLTMLASSSTPAAIVYHLSAGESQASKWQTLFKQMEQGYELAMPIERQLFRTMNEALSTTKAVASSDTLRRLGIDERQYGTLMRAMRHYFPYASANVAFDNQRLLQHFAGSISMPMSFADDYIQRCIATSRQQSFWEQFQID